ncbi:MAG: TonB-dependent receptor [Pseudomonadales bacterium]
MIILTKKLWGEKLPLAALGSALLVFTPTVTAQDFALEEVIVTATKRVQNLQDVAIAVTALSAGDLIANQIRSSTDLATLVPSLNVQKGSNNRQTSFNIRGIGTQSFSTAVEPSVSTMVDGVVMGRSLQAFMQLMDLERVEVLRGPQGTLFGKNATAGVVHLITQNPSEEFTGEALLGYEEGNTYRAGLNVSGPLSDQLGFRFSAIGSTEDGWITNVFNGEEYNNSDEWSMRAKLRWTPNDNLELQWSSDYARMDCNCTVSPLRSANPDDGIDLGVLENTLNGILPVVPGLENSLVNVNNTPYNDQESWGHSLQANWDIGEFSLTSITAYRESSIVAFTDNDGQPVDPLGFFQIGGTDQEQFTQELRLASPNDARLNYVVGLFYFDQKVSRQFTRSFMFPGFDPGIGISTFSVDTTNWAAFGQATFNITDDWRIVGGLRYTEDQLDFVFERTREGFPVGVPAPIPSTPGGTDEDDFSGKASLEWSVSEDSMLYLSYAQGYKGPAYDVTFGTDPTTLQPVKPETSDSWELGFKSTFWDGRMRFNVAVFESSYEDFQGQAFFDPDGTPDCPADMPGCDPSDEPGSFALINAGEVKTSGIEIDFDALLSENFRLSGGLALVDAEIIDYQGANCSFGQTSRGECPDGSQDLSGGEMPFSPDWKANVRAQYTIRTGSSFDVILQGTVRAQDEVLFDLSQDENSRFDGYEVVDIAVLMVDKNDRWSANLYVKNVLDEFYVSGIGSLPGVFFTNAYIHSIPKHAERTVGVDFGLKF